MYKYNVYVVEVLTGKIALEFEVVNGDYPNEEIAKKYGEMMWGPNKELYKVQIKSTFR